MSPLEASLPPIAVVVETDADGRFIARVQFDVSGTSVLQGEHPSDPSAAIDDLRVRLLEQLRWNPGVRYTQ